MKVPGYKGSLKRNVTLGPSLLFDKSFLQSLSVDEAAILDQMFACTISPLFFAETRADLAKEQRGSRHPTQIIAELATKTPVCHGYMNVFHSRALLEELLGHDVPMDYRPMVAGGIPVRTEDGLGMVYKQSPEALAFERWQEHRFLDVERIAAKLWRRSLGELNLPAIRDAFQAILKKEHRPKNQQEAFKIAQGIVEAPGHNYRTLAIAHSLLDLPAESFRDIVRLWKAAGGNPLKVYAPFTAYCLQIDLYFYLCLSNGIISDQRASNKVDMGYLYYAPFANAFVSSDRLHRAHAPMFMGADQMFIWGPELKADLASLNQHFLSLSDEEKAQGLFTLASKPPLDHEGICTRAWDRFRAGWRKPKGAPLKLPPEIERKIIKDGNRLIAAAEMADMPPPPRPASRYDEGKLDRLILRRAIPRERGSWRMFSKEVEKAENARHQKG